VLRDRTVDCGRGRLVQAAIADIGHYSEYRKLRHVTAWFRPTRISRR